jgi:hypothetical protein
VLHREVAHQRVHPLGLPAVRHARDHRELSRDDAVVLIHGLPSARHALHLGAFVDAEVARDVVVEVAEAEETAEREPLRVVDAPAKRRLAVFAQGVVRVLASLGKRDAVTPFLSEPSRQLRG